MAADICLPVLKFSHATGVRSDNTIPWTHLSASDIFVIVKGQHTHIPDGHLSMSIVQGNTALEDLNVGKYIDTAIEARRRAEDAGVMPQVEQLPIFGITKEAALAVRCRQEDGKARRLQLRMRNTTDCQQIHGVFQRRGMEFQMQRPNTAKQGADRPGTASSLNRPLTVQTGSPYFDSAAPIPRPSPFNFPSIEAESLSQARPLSAERSQGQITHRYETPALPSNEMPPPRLFTRDESLAPREVLPNRPTTAQMYRSYTTLSQQSQYDASEMRGVEPGPQVERPSSTSQTKNVEAIRDAVGGYEDPQNVQNNGATIMPPAWPNEYSSVSTIENTNLGVVSSDPRPTSARPSTAATMMFPETLEHEIPPRRELPFKRPQSKSSGAEKSNSRPATSALTLPPLPRPKMAKEDPSSPTRPASTSPAKEASPSRPHNTSPLKRSFETYQDKTPSPAKALENVSQRQPPSYSTEKTSTFQNRLASPEPQWKIKSPMDELLARNKALAERSTNARVPRLNSLADAPHEIESPPGSAQSPKRFNSATSPRLPDTRDDFTTCPCATGDSPNQRGETAALREYASQSREDRQATIDEFMVANLENADFTTLCEDVENCWRRIALGL